MREKKIVANNKKARFDFFIEDFPRSLLGKNLYMSSQIIFEVFSISHKVYWVTFAIDYI